MSKTKILIVDDKEENLFALEKLLNIFDLKIIKAYSGNEALKQMIEHEFALVLMDVQMPDMDGFETVSLMREDKKLENTPVIFISAIYIDEIHSVKGIESGAVDFIIKPIIPEVLTGKVKIFINLYEDRKRLKKLNEKLTFSQQKLLETQQSLLKAQKIGKIGSFSIQKEDGNIEFSEEALNIHKFDRHVQMNLENYIHYIHEDDQLLFTTFLKNHSQDNEASFLNYRIKDSEQSWKWIKLSKEIDTDSKGKEFRVFGIMQDVTEIINIEKNLKQAEKMQAIGQLAGGIAHDFNNQLGMIIGNAELSLFSLKDNPDNESIIKRLNSIIDVATQSAELTGKLLSYARKGNVIVEDINLNRLIDKVLQKSNFTENDKIIFNREFCDTNLIFKGDPSQIYSAIFNILTNSIESMVSGGTITFRTELMNLSDKENSKSGEYLCLEIIDTGTGIEENLLNKIYDPFFTTKELGTGMGLSAVSGIMKKHKGEINIASIPGKGTTVKLMFPYFKI